MKDEEAKKDDGYFYIYCPVTGEPIDRYSKESINPAIITNMINRGNNER